MAQKQKLAFHDMMVAHNYKKKKKRKRKKSRKNKKLKID
jgi:hypothetical protein